MAPVRCVRHAGTPLCLRCWHADNERRRARWRTRRCFDRCAASCCREPTRTNDEGAPAYALPPKHALAQYAATGCLNSTFYASAEEQLDEVLELCAKVDAEFIAADGGVLPRAWLHEGHAGAAVARPVACTSRDCSSRVFARVSTTARCSATSCRSCARAPSGRKSLGTRPKRLVRRGSSSATDEAFFEARSATTPSLADIVKMVHPKPRSARARGALRVPDRPPHDAEALPGWSAVRGVQGREPSLRGAGRAVPDADRAAAGAAEWAEIARNGSWQMTG